MADENQGNPESTTETINPDEMSVETGLDSNQEDQIAAELLESMGGDPTDRRSLAKIKTTQVYQEALSENHPGRESQPEESTGKKWVHEPTGKEFDSELDYYKFNSGWTADNLGKKNKELLEQLEEAKKPKEPAEQGAETQPQQQEPLGDLEIKKALWPELSDEQLKDPVVDVVYNGINKVADMMQASFDEKLSQVKQLYEQNRKETEVEKLRREFGVTQEMEEKVLENYPQLADMDPLQRIGVVKGLSGGGKAETSTQPKPASTPQQKVARRNPAEDHVEPTSPSPMEEFHAEPGTGGMTDDEFDKIAGTDKGMDVLKRAIRQNGGFFGMDQM